MLAKIAMLKFMCHMTCMAGIHINACEGVIYETDAFLIRNSQILVVRTKACNDYEEYLFYLKPETEELWRQYN